MTSEQLEKRRRVMQRSMALGHCICDIRQPCPCDLFRQKSICHCAGETIPTNGDAVRLTEHVRAAGCASKISKGVLHEVLKGLPELNDPRVLVGSSAGDDAGVIMLDERSATILTVDVFSPAVDDPYTFGQIAAANSLSDIYAMGGKPQVALSIIGFPVHALPASAMREILRGGLEKMHEAGVPVIGGHSINDEEIKCGFAVVGTAPPQGYIRNAGAQIGDVVVLTKPLGSGILCFANQLKRATPEAMTIASNSMASLNHLAGEAMVRHHARAATDVTGFGLLGHLAEIVRAGNVQVDLDFDSIPLFPEVQALACADVLPGAVERNRESVSGSLLRLEDLAPAQQAILFAPETSGGLMVFLAPHDAENYLDELRGAGVEAKFIGAVSGSSEGGFIRATTRERWESSPLARSPANGVFPRTSEPVAGDRANGESCCASPAGDASASLPAPASSDAFKQYMKSVSAPGALDIREKKLIALALSVMSKCEPCIRLNVRAAQDAGASDAQIAEAISLGIAFGGAPVAMFYETIRKTNGGGE